MDRIKMNDIVMQKDVNNKLFKVVSINYCQLLIKNIVTQESMFTHRDLIIKFDTEVLDLSKPTLIMSLIDNNIINSLVAIRQYNKHNVKFEKEHSLFIEMIKKRNCLNDDKLPLKMGLAWC